MNDIPEQLFTKKEKMTFRHLDNYFKSCTKAEVDRMLSIINKESNISLRILDWFVTRYAKNKNDCTIDIGNNDDEEEYDVHINYKAQLRSYKKTYFDPFRRRKKFYYNYNDNDVGKKVYTTLGQLNFFKWAMTYNIIDYVEKNLSELTKAMNIATKEENIKKKNIKNINNDSNSNNSSDSDSDNDNDSDSDEIDIISNKSNKKIQIRASDEIVDDEIQIILKFD